MSDVGERGSLRADVVSGYVLAASRVIAWAGVSAIVYRVGGPESFAILVMFRATITLIGYAAVGVTPAMVRRFAEVEAEEAKHSRFHAPAQNASHNESPTIAYANPTTFRSNTVYASGDLIAFVAAGVVGLAMVGYLLIFDRVHAIPQGLHDVSTVVILGFAAGAVCRLITESDSAVLQSRHQLAKDQLFLAAGEWAWLLLTSIWLLLVQLGLIRWKFYPAAAASLTFAAASFVVLSARLYAVNVGHRDIIRDGETRWPEVSRLLTFGSAILIAQLADFLYAPANYVLINRFLSNADLATYAPLVQIDAALLLAVAGVASAIYPRIARAHASGDFNQVRRLFISGTVGGALVLLTAGAFAFALSPWLFHLWLGGDLPDARALLPLVLIHTIVGGSGAVGRQVLIGMNRVRAATAAALIAGVANVLLALLFAVVLGWGLKGIVLATVTVVTIRAGLWTPWYVLRCLKHEEQIRFAAPNA